MSPDRSGSKKTAGTIALIVLLVGAVPFGAALFGVPPAQAVLLGALGATLCALIRFRPSTVDPPNWPEATILDQDHGARRDIARLSWSVSGNDRQVGRTLRLRLRQVALRRLARRGIDLTDPDMRDAAIEALGADGADGADAYRALDPDLREVIGLTTFISAVHAVESLESTR